MQISAVQRLTTSARWFASGCGAARSLWRGNLRAASAPHRAEADALEARATA
jgi:hypothetical protein